MVSLVAIPPRSGPCDTRDTAMSVEFLAWRDATLQSVRRVISILRSIDGEDAVGQASRPTRMYIGLELLKLRSQPFEGDFISNLWPAAVP
jgi:hypothetical protein